jgi:hypothetical protein
LASASFADSQHPALARTEFAATETAGDEALSPSVTTRHSMATPCDIGRINDIEELSLGIFVGEITTTDPSVLSSAPIFSMTVDGPSGRCSGSGTASNPSCTCRFPRVRPRFYPDGIVRDFPDTRRSK